MAPTEILARQHFNSMQNFLFEYWISSELLVWSTTVKHKKEIKEKLKTWNLDVIIWTHALVQDDVIFKNLWLVIIDEQHRFWVKQRQSLELWEWNGSGLVPHSLNMTATPIPRTLALTLYWNQDLSIINEYPKWRKEIFTKVAHNDHQREQIELFIESELKKWRQVFWVSPLVEESEKIDLANAKNTFETLEAIYQEFNVWLVHWKMKAKDKEKVMADFKENKIQILSSTTVIEVWIDIPNASIICIEWAERFGLSQLHQIRWRVGRWEFQSYCYLFPTKWQKTDRLKAMEKTNNGFELSEIDLELRWPWEVYWVKQSWVPDLKVAELTDLELISQIREDIEEMFKEKL
jgi:ATP-dependent DNA helicase RecG